MTACELHSKAFGPVGAPSLVLLTGLGMSLREWPPDFIAALAREWRVILLDNRDAGRSARTGPDLDHASWSQLEAVAQGGTVSPAYDLAAMAADVVVCLDRLSVGQAAVLGFSMGGMIAQHVTLSVPHRVTALALLSTSATPTCLPAETGRRFRRLADPEAPPSARRAWLADDITYFAAPARIPEREARRQARQMQNDGFTQGGFARQYLAMLSAAPWAQRLKALTMPVFIASGMQDTCLPTAHAMAIEGAIPGASMARISGLGHSMEPALCKAAEGWLSATLHDLRRHRLP